MFSRLLPSRRAPTAPSYGQHDRVRDGRVTKPRLLKTNLKAILSGGQVIVRKTPQQIQREKAMKMRVREEEAKRHEHEEAERRKEARLRAEEERQEYLDEREREREAAREEREHQRKLEMARLRLDRLDERSRSRHEGGSSFGGSDSGYSERSRSRDGRYHPHGPNGPHEGYAPQQPQANHPWWSPFPFQPPAFPGFGPFSGYGHAPPPQQPVNVTVNNVNGASPGHAQTGAASTNTGTTHDQAQRGRSRSRSRDPQEEAHRVLREVRSGSKDVHAKVYPDGRVRNDSAYGGSDDGRGRSASRDRRVDGRARDDSAYYGSDAGQSRSGSKSRSRAATPHDAQSHHGEGPEEDQGYHSEYERSPSRGRDQRSRSTGPPRESSSARGRSASSRPPGPQGTSGPLVLRNNTTALVPHNQERAFVRHNTPSSQTAGQGRNTQTAMVVHQRRR